MRGFLRRAPASRRDGADVLGLGAYLVRTLSREHEDRKLPPGELADALGREHNAKRFMGLSILHAHEEDDVGEVLFVARVFERGQDRSFAELSTFLLEDGAWGYARGILLHGEHLPRDVTSLTRERFVGLAELLDARLVGRGADAEIEDLLHRVYVGEGHTEPARAAARFAGKAVRDRGELLAARGLAGALVGMVVVVEPTSPWRRIAGPSEAEIQLLAVDASHRGRGTGERLVRAAVLAAAERGLSRVVLWTQPAMREAQRIYERLGFTRDPVRDFERDGRRFLVFVFSR